MTHKVSTMKLVFGVHCRLFPAKTKQSEGVYAKSMVRGEPVSDSILLTREQFNELKRGIAGDAFEAVELLKDISKTPCTCGASVRANYFLNKLKIKSHEQTI